MDGRRINLTFHGIGPPPRALTPGEAEVWLEPARFEAVLDAVRGRSDVWLSFDDGNASDVEYGLPALAERGLTGTFFLVAGRLGQPGFLSADDVQELVEAGMTVGCHGMRHTAWRGLDEGRLGQELQVARDVLQEVCGRPVRDAACPFGAYDRRVLGALRGAGYRRVFTSDGGLARADRWLQPRHTVTVHDPDSPLRAADVRSGSPAGAAVRGLKRAVKRWR